VRLRGACLIQAKRVDHSVFAVASYARLQYSERAPCVVHGVPVIACRERYVNRDTLNHSRE